MTEYILSISFYIYVPLVIVAIATQLLILRKLVFTWYDPLFTYLFFNSFSIAFVIYLFFDNQIYPVYLITFILSNIFFIAGLRLGNKKLDGERRNIYKAIVLDDDYGDVATNDVSIFKKYSKQLNIILYISVFILLISNVILFFQYGSVPLFSENAEVAKVEFRNSGFGFIYRINDALLPSAIAVIIIKLLNPKIQIGKYQYLSLIFCLLILMFIALSGGSKGAILLIVNMIFYIYLINKQFNSKYTKIINTSILILFFLGISIVLFIFWRASIAVQYLNLSEALLVRLVGSGDVFYYFYTYDLMNVFDYNPIDYLINSINPLLSLLRLSEYNPALGERIISEAIGLSTGGFGVNPQHPIEGLIYFGFVGSWIYSLIIGYIVSVIRTRLLLFTLKRPHQLNLLLYMVCGYQILKLPVDSNLLLESLYSTFLIGIPIFMYVQLFFQSKSTSIKPAGK
ncbi:MAG: O-antigen polymerase [Aulosira sp. ZfuVER01]|nr:O-antigen polymerase [Aulosira sp. ZfuVER01]MDZ7999168.1 O-antigen polymerase [Aulosira sp. DedVER01a]MDZ8051108.1 O-antigen polymerase [Aulosira sp. ZfuCHP01]